MFTQSDERYLPLPIGLSSRLDEYRKGFAAALGEPMFFADGRTSRTTVMRMMKVHEASGGPFIRFHDLRHSYATHLIDISMSPLIVSKHLRHSSAKETLDAYSHVFPNETAEAIDGSSGRFAADLHASDFRGFVKLPSQKIVLRIVLQIALRITKNADFIGTFVHLVGTAGFEPATSWSRTRRTTKLCYVPMRIRANVTIPLSR